MTETRAAPPGDDFDLLAEASAFYESFPDFQGRLTFVDLGKGQVINSDPDRGRAIMALLQSPEGRANFGPVIAQCMKAKTSYSWQNGQGDRIIFVYTADDRPRFFGGAVSRARELRFIVDHEIGHAVVPEGSDDERLKAENAADAFALIRDLMRHRDTYLAEAALLFRTNYALLSNAGIINFSSPTIEKILETAQEIVNRNPAPADTVALAGQLARDLTPDPEAIKTLDESLAKLREQPSLATLANIVLETPLPETFRWTATALKAMLRGEVRLGGTTAEDFAAAARDLPPKIEERERQFAAARKPPVNALP